MTFKKFSLVILPLLFASRAAGDPVAGGPFGSNYGSAGVGANGYVSTDAQTFEGAKTVLGNLTVQTLASPNTPTATLTTGTLAAGTYYYSVTAQNAVGTTVPSNPRSFTLAAPGGVTLTWNSVTGAKTYRIYGRGATPGTRLLMATVMAPTVTWTDDGSVTPAGAAPVLNTTAKLTTDGTTVRPTPIVYEDSAVVSHIWFDGARLVDPRNDWTTVGTPTFGSGPLYSASNFAIGVRQFTLPSTNPLNATLPTSGAWSGVVVFKVTDTANGGILTTGNDTNTGYRLYATAGSFAGSIAVTMNFPGFSGGTKILTQDNACGLNQLCVVCWGMYATNRVGMSTNTGGFQVINGGTPFTIGAGNTILGNTATISGSGVVIYELMFNTSPITVSTCAGWQYRIHGLLPISP